MRIVGLLLPGLVVAALAGCGAKYTLGDLDGDGYTALDGDCWDQIAGPDGSDVGGASIYPGATEVWYDGVDEDCAGDDDGDQDGDGVDSVRVGGTDCDDTDAAIYPGAADTWYDGVDSDCAGNDDYDEDGDGFDVPQGGGADCNDTDASIYPGATDTWYDGVDSDCAGDDDYDQDGDGFDLADDCDDTDPARYPYAPIAEIWYNGIDENCDGNDGDQDGDGYVPDAYAAQYDWTQFPEHKGTGDCWDDPTTVPAAFEPLNGFSALTADEVGPTATERYYDGNDQDCAGGDDFDQDGDGYDSSEYGDAHGIVGDDCDDADATIWPGAPDTWYDGVDSDCAGNDDNDADGDGYDAIGFGSSDDCDDSSAAINPGATEVCDPLGIDEDCDGDTNELNAVGCTDWHIDADSDGYGGADVACYCSASGAYTATDATDCDDSDPSVLNSRTWYEDADGDGYGDASLPEESCSRPTGTAAVSGDCDESNAAINPGATEVCDSGNVDEDCDGLADDADPSVDPSTKITVYTDADGDGYGATASSVCDIPTGDVLVSGDCDDSAVWIFPGASEIVADGIDEDCDGTEICYTDTDGDGYRVDTTLISSDADCDDPGEALATETDGDCDDHAAAVYPGALEIPGDEIDENCDGAEICYVDADGDGTRVSTTMPSADADCTDPGEATRDEPSGDCDDSDPRTYPGAVELCDNIDEDCDGDVLDVDLDGDGTPDFTNKVLSLSRSSGDYLQVASDPALDFGRNSFTVEAWVSANDFDAGGVGSPTVRLLDRTRGAYPTDPYWALDLDDFDGYGYPRLEVAGMLGGTLQDGTTYSDDGFATDTWFHVAVVVDVDADTVTYYLDGDTSGPLSLPPGFSGSDVSDSAPLTVSSVVNSFDGMVDELRIWNIARSPSEIRDGRCKPIASTDPAFIHLILYMPFETDMADHGPHSLGVSSSGSPTLIAAP